MLFTPNNSDDNDCNDSNIAGNSRNNNGELYSIRYPTASMDMNRLASLSPSHGHDFQPKNKLIMVRKTEKRVFAEGKDGEVPTLRTITRTTVQTFDGNNKVLRKVTKQKKGDDESETPVGTATPGTPATRGTMTPATTFGAATPRTMTNGTPLPLSKSIINGNCNGASNGDVSSLERNKDRTQSPPASSTKIPQPVSKVKTVYGVNGVSDGVYSTSGGTSTPVTTYLRERQQNDVGQQQIRQDFATECLQAHNEYRRLHGVPELKLDRKLCKYSQEWADHLAKVKTTSHRPNSDYGENIFFFWSSNPRERVHGRDPVDNWYKEIEKHVFGVEPKTLISGHMTQVLWKTSQRLGVGVARNTDGQTYVVCNYNPAGNYVGTYARNVPPIGGFENEEEEDFLEQALRLHNEYRQRHSVPPLTLDQQLCKHAQDWADNLAKTKTFQHRPSNPYGENIFAMRSSDQVTAADACTSWYSEEVKYHSYGQEPSRLDPPAGHFTQIVWKETKLFGIGRATADNGKVIIVANYHPRGNIISKFAENVFKPHPKNFKTNQNVEREILAKNVQ